MDTQWIVPFLPRDTIVSHAESLISKHHPSRELPIPIEDIIDIKLRIDIVPVPGLTKVLCEDEDDGIESFVNSSLTQIFVDENAYRRQTNRYRFSIAHELAHIELHQSIFAHLRVESIEDWKTTVKSIPTREYARLEWQAYCFAGHVLVPTMELSENLRPCFQRVMEEGINPRDESVRPFIEKHLAGVFAVSSEVVHRRIEDEGLWRQAPT